MARYASEAAMFRDLEQRKRKLMIEGYTERLEKLRLHGPPNAVILSDITRNTAGIVIPVPTQLWDSIKQSLITTYEEELAKLTDEQNTVING